MAVYDPSNDINGHANMEEENPRFQPYRGRQLKNAERGEIVFPREKHIDWLSNNTWLALKTYTYKKNVMWAEQVVFKYLGKKLCLFSHWLLFQTSLELLSF